MASVTAIITAGIQLADWAAKMLAAGRTEITEEELDDKLAEIQDSDNDLSAAIARAEAREGDSS